MRKQFSVVVSLGIMLLLSPVLRAQQATAEMAMKCAVVPAADVVIVSDAAKIKEAPITAELEKMKDENQNQAPDMLDMQEKLEALWEDCGLEEENVKLFQLSLVIEGLDFQGIQGGNFDFNTLNGLAAVETSVAVTPATLLEGLTKAAARENKEVKFNEASYNGVAMLGVEAAEPGGGRPPFEVFLAPVAGGKVLYAGMETQVKAAIDRLNAATPESMSANLKGAREMVPKGAQFFVLFSPNQMMRDMIAQQAQQTNNPMAGAMQGLVGLKGLTMSGKLSNTMEFEIRGDFQQASQAQQVQTAIDVMALGMVRMGLMQAAQGQNLPLAQALKCVVENQTQVAIKAPMTLDDMKVLQSLQNQGGGMGGPPMPPPGGPAPGIPAP